jgi:hypothetical protein
MLGLPIIGKLLGHTQATTTNRYAHLDNDPLHRASEHVGGRIAAAMGEPVRSRRAGPRHPIRDDTRAASRGEQFCSVFSAKPT